MPDARLHVCTVSILYCLAINVMCTTDCKCTVCDVIIITYCVPTILYFVNDRVAIKNAGMVLLLVVYACDIPLR